MTQRAPNLLSGTALAGFRLNGQFLAVADELARPAGLTAAWCQVLGAVLREPLSVAAVSEPLTHPERLPGSRVTAQLGRDGVNGADLRAFASTGTVGARPYLR